MRSKINIILTVLVINFLASQQVFARGGGGGSGGGGGGGGGGHGGSGGSSSPLGIFIYLIIFAIVYIVGYFAKKEKEKKRAQLQKEIIFKDHLDWPALESTFEQIFYKFEEAWGKLDLPGIKPLLTDDYYKRMVLELNVLQNEKRINPMRSLKLYSVKLMGEEAPGETTQKLIVQISASANDVLIDTELNKELFIDYSNFTEYWHFISIDGNWKLDFITQETENIATNEPEIKLFADANKFYYDADFGWLMMPNKGVLFNKTNFGKSDINNHVIGYYHNKIVEFYTYIQNPDSQFSSTNYLIAQAILPINYKNILIKKNNLFNFPPWGLKRITLEWPDFNKKFCLWSNPQDQVNSLELLTPNFMEKIYKLPFELNIEIVGNVLYFYTKDRGAGNYSAMLEVLSWAFDEMKM